MERTYKPSPAAGIAVRKALLDKKMTVKVLAEEINLTYSYVSQILSGSKDRPKALQMMCEHVGLNYFDYVDTKM